MTAESARDTGNDKDEAKQATEEEEGLGERDDSLRRTDERAAERRGETPPAPSADEQPPGA
jgi:hypothetical protein